MRQTGNFPEQYMENLQRLQTQLHVDEETAMAMLLMTAALMDLYPDDETVADTVLRDCESNPAPAYA